MGTGGACSWHRLEKCGMRLTEGVNERQAALREQGCVYSLGLARRVLKGSPGEGIWAAAPPEQTGAMASGLSQHRALSLRRKSRGFPCPGRESKA